MTRTWIRILGVSVLSVTLMIGSAVAYASELPDIKSSEPTTQAWGAAAVKSGSQYTLEQMLLYAIQDEYSAQAEYAAIIKAFNVSRPFSNIIKAEGTHIGYLETLFDKYDISIPSNTAKDYVVLPPTVSETYAIGVDAEIKNIAMYDIFLKQDLPADIKVVFEALKKGSESHLKAFNNKVNKF